MTDLEIGLARLVNQRIVGSDFTRPEQVVSWLGAVQAQDYPGTLWALGLRIPGATQATIEQAIAERTIVRTWPMRGTLHFVPAADARWMLQLLTPSVLARTASRYRQLELDEEVFAQSRVVLTRALQGGNQLSRPEIYDLLEQNGIPPTGQRGIHIIGHLSQKGLLCFSSHNDKQPTFALLDEWLPPAREWRREEGLAELARRFFTSHGPATLADLVRWAGLKVSDARLGLELAKSQLAQEEINGQTYWLSAAMPTIPAAATDVYLLPGFDEYLLGYADRTTVLSEEHSDKIVPGGNGMFKPTIISQGRVVGTWKRTVKRNKLIITPEPFAPLNQTELTALEQAIQPYGHFMGLPAELS